MKHRSHESGFVLLKALIMSGICAIVIGGGYHLLKNRIDWMTIVRIQQRMEMLKDLLENTGKSFGAMRASALKNPGSALERCLVQKQCLADGLFNEIALYDGLGRQVTGTFDLNGKSCKENCSLVIKSELQVICPDGAAACSQPSEIITRYSIQKRSDVLTKRQFKAIEGEVALSTFSCPANQYIRAITSDGQLQCAPAEISPNGARCSDEMAAVGLDTEGNLICQKVINLCKTPIGISAVLDVSGSMNSNRGLEAAKRSISTFMDKLDEDKDDASYTNFSTFSSTPLRLTRSRKKLFDFIFSERAFGATNMSAGLEAGARTLDGYKKGEKAMIFVSDGFHNTGNQDPVTVANTIKASGIRIFTIAVTTAADRNTLRRIASTPTDFFDAPEPGQLDAVFDQLSKQFCR